MSVQSSWQFCQKCYALFYNGRSDQGACAAGGAHSPHGDDFVLSHDIPITSKSQAFWRFCQNCYAMFYAGRSDQGVCKGAAGGPHSAQGDNFVLSFIDLNPVIDNIQVTDEFVVTGSNFFPSDQLTLSYELSGGSAFSTVPGSAGCVAASDGSFSCPTPVQGYPGPDFELGTVSSFGVTARDQHGNYALASCQVDAEGSIVNFQKGQSA